MYTFFFLLEFSHFTVTRVLFTYPIKMRREKMLELKKYSLRGKTRKKINKRN